MTGAEKLAAGMAKLRPTARALAGAEAVPVPIMLDTPAFRLRWASWLQYRREMKKPLTPTSQAQQLDNFLKTGEARAIAMIEHTITMGWQGLREPDAPAAAAASAPGQPKRNGSLPYLQIPTAQEWAEEAAKKPPKTPEQLAADARFDAEMDEIAREYKANKAAKEAAQKAKEQGQK